MRARYVLALTTRHAQQMNKSSDTRAEPCKDSHHSECNWDCSPGGSADILKDEPVRGTPPPLHPKPVSL